MALLSLKKDEKIFMNVVCCSCAYQKDKDFAIVMLAIIRVLAIVKFASHLDTD